MELAVFSILAIGMLVFAGNVVLRRNPAVCALHLVGTFFCLSGVYLLIGFPFLAAIQLMVYAGAIMVLFIFVIMLLDLGRETEGSSGDERPWFPALLAGGVLGLLISVFPYFDINVENLPASNTESSVIGGRSLAEALFSEHLIAFEATSLLLLAGIIAVLVLAKKRRRPVLQQGALLQLDGLQEPGLDVDIESDFTVTDEIAPSSEADDGGLPS